MKSQNDKYTPDIRFLPCDVEIIRESIFLDKYGYPIHISQALPKYIPKEPTKACVSSPLKRTDSMLSSGTGRMSSLIFNSELESDAASIYTQSTLASVPYRDKKHTEPKRPSINHRKRKTRVRSRPVNVVGPIISSQYDVLCTANPDADEEIFSVSDDGDSADLDTERLPVTTPVTSVISSEEEKILKDELVAQKKLISKLENDLSSQIKVNTELKKLLVASIGSDLEYKVEKLAMDKAQLAATVGSYSAKLYKDFEDLDRLAIQADMWRSKYMASRLQCEELSQVKLASTQKYYEATSTLQKMLQERSRIYANLTEVKSLLEIYNTKQAAPAKHAESQTLINLSEELVSLARLCGQDKLRTVIRDKPGLDKLLMSPAEQEAYKVLSLQTIELLEPVEVPQTESIPRLGLFCQMYRKSHSYNCKCDQCLNQLKVI